MQRSSFLLLFATSIFALHLAGSMAWKQVKHSLEKSIVGQNRNKCVSSKANSYLVFRSQASRNISGYYQLIFQPDDQQVSEVHMWTFREGKAGDFRTQTLSIDDVNAIKAAFRFQLLGVTQRKRVQRYKRREARLKNKCRSLCFKKLRRIEKVLKLKPTTNSSRCQVEKEMESTSN